MSDPLTCPVCRNYWDTPGHELGCGAPRKYSDHDDWYPEHDEEEDDDDYNQYPYTI